MAAFCKLYSASRSRSEGAKPHLLSPSLFPESAEIAHQPPGGWLFLHILVKWELLWS